MLRDDAGYKSFVGGEAWLQAFYDEEIVDPSSVHFPKSRFVSHRSSAATSLAHGRDITSKNKKLSLFKAARMKSFSPARLA